MKLGYKLGRLYRVSIVKCYLSEKEIYTTNILIQRLGVISGEIVSFNELVKKHWSSFQKNDRCLNTFVSLINL